MVAGKTVQGFLLQVKQTGPLVVLLLSDWPAATLSPWGASVHLLPRLSEDFHYSYRNCQNRTRLDSTLWYWSFWIECSAAWKYKQCVVCRAVPVGATMR